MPAEILHNLVENRGNEAKLRRKLAANRPSNWLLGVLLNSFAKASEGGQLTDLEDSLVTSFQDHHFSESTMRALGEGYRNQMPHRLRAELFPGKFASLGPDTVYSFADLEADAGTIVLNVASMPNFVNVDVDTVHAGVIRPRDALSVRPDVLREAGASHVRVVAPNVQPPNPTYSIKATWFRCIDQTDEWSASDEPYWLFGIQAPGLPKGVSSNSHVYEDENVQAPNAYPFPADEGCIWGENCLKQDLPDGEIASIVQLIEHDAGDVGEIKAGWDAAVAGVSGVLAAAGVTAWVSAVIAALGGIVSWIIGMQDDDPIAHETFTFTRQVINNQLGKTAPGYFDITRLFTDGDAEYRLRIRITRY
jgi:hypothetical protein